MSFAALTSQDPSVRKVRVARKRPAGYLPTLDGWRAIAILCVLFYHGSYLSIGPIGTGWLYAHGEIGVELFFAISGFLICSRLLDEEKKFGSISLPSFYIRRAFRILPPAITMLLAVAALDLAGVIHLHLREWIGALLFFHNYSSLLGPASVDSFFLNHFWSLAVEEHFYLILPGVLVLTRRRWRVITLLSLALTVELYRSFVLRTTQWNLVSHHTGCRLDALLIPAALAVIASKTQARKVLTNLALGTPLVLGAVILLVTYGHSRGWEVTALAVLMAMLVLGSVLNSGSYLGRALEWAPLRFIGRISYSVYLWQELFFTGHFRPQSSPFGFLGHFPMDFVVTIGIAALSYYFIERPMMQMGRRLAPRFIPGRDELAVK